VRVSPARASEGCTVRHPSAEQGDDAPPHRVLYVDDNRDVTESAVLLLRLVGFEAKGCYDGPTALATAAEFRPEVCMLDLNMPGMEGDELAVLLRERFSPLVLVAVTAMSDERSQKRIASAGFDMHLVKPVDPFTLVGVVNALWSTLEKAEATPPDQDPSV
jgi:DNA-binding response OmpR family regulator